MSEWISVEDRLPDLKYGAGYVLVACQGGNVDKSFFNSSREFGNLTGKSYSRRHQGKNSGFFEISHEWGYQVTHWMPLPAPPESL